MNDPQNLFADYVFESKDLMSMFSTTSAKLAFNAETPDWVRIPAGAFGRGVPLTPIEVTPDYLIPVSGPLVELWFGEPSAAIMAYDLIGRFGISKLTSDDTPVRSAMRGPKFHSEGLMILSADEVALLMELDTARDGKALLLGAACQDDDIFISKRAQTPVVATAQKPRRRWV